MMVLPSRIENKFIFILTFALATPFLRARDPLGGPDPQVGKPCSWVSSETKNISNDPREHKGFIGVNLILSGQTK